MKLEAGKIAVVTGGASGIGFALADRFATAGMHVVLADVDEAGLATAAAQIGASGVDTAVALVARADAVGEATVRGRWWSEPFSWRSLRVISPSWYCPSSFFTRSSYFARISAILCVSGKH